MSKCQTCSPGDSGIFVFFFPHQFLTYHLMTPTLLWRHGNLCKGASRVLYDPTDITWEVPQLKSCTQATVSEFLLFHTLELCLTDPLCRKEAFREAHWKPIVARAALDGCLGWGESCGHGMQHDLSPQQNEERFDILSCEHEWHGQIQAEIAVELKRVTETIWQCGRRQLACLQRAIKANPNNLWESWPAPPGIFVLFLQQYLFLNCIVLHSPWCYEDVLCPFNLERNKKIFFAFHVFESKKAEPSEDLTTWNSRSQ